MTREQAEKFALKHYSEHVGKFLLVDYVLGYVNDDTVDVACDPPVVVQVQQTGEHSVLHWNDEWLDPYWDAVVVQGDAGGLTSVYIDGPSINTKTGEITWHARACLDPRMETANA